MWEGHTGDKGRETHRQGKDPGVLVVLRSRQPGLGEHAAIGHRNAAGTDDAATADARIEMTADIKLMTDDRVLLLLCMHESDQRTSHAVSHMPWRLARSSVARSV